MEILTHKSNTMQTTNCNNLQNPLPFGAREPPSNTPMPGSTHSSPQTTARSIHALSHNYTTKSPLVIMGCLKLTFKMPLHLRR